MNPLRVAACLGGLAAASCLFGSLPARADSIRDSVQQHLNEGLEKDRKPAPRRAESTPKAKPKPKQRPAKRRSSASGQGQGIIWSSSAPEPESKPRDPDPLPRRIFGEQLKLDPKAGGGYRGWLAQDYPRVSVPHTGFFTWSLEVKGRFFRYVTLRRGYFESNGLSAPRNQTASTVARVGQHAPKAAWLLGAIGLEISRAWQPIISYETRAFESSAIPQAPVRIVPHDTPGSTDPTTLTETTQPLQMVSGFETFVAGIRYDHSKQSSGVIGGSSGAIPPFYLGLGLIQYAKPYQVRVGEDALDSLLFDARFRGAGLAFGFDTAEKPDRAFVDFSGQLGLGEVRLLENTSLNGQLPPDWMIGYAQGNVTVGYLYPLLRTRPTVFLSGALNGGGMTFFYFKTKVEEGEQIASSALNWDFLWGARASVIIPL